MKTFVLLAIAVSLTVSLNAAPITFSFAGTGSGSISATPFNNAAFSVVINGNTTGFASQPTLGADGYEGLAGTINIAGIGTASFTLPLFVFGGNGLSEVGFGEDISLFPGAPGNLITVLDASITGYGLTSSFGPVSSTNFSLSQFKNVGTSLGTLSYTAMSSVSFAASTTTPEPTTASFLGVSLVAMFWMRCRKRV